MPWFFIRTVNSSFVSTDGGAAYEGTEQAIAAGIKAGVDIAVYEIGQGEDHAGVEVTILNHQDKPVSRSVVTIAVAELLPLSAS